MRNKHFVIALLCFSFTAGYAQTYVEKVKFFKVVTHREGDSPVMFHTSYRKGVYLLYSKLNKNGGSDYTKLVVDKKVKDVHRIGWPGPQAVEEDDAGRLVYKVVYLDGEMEYYYYGYWDGTMTMVGK